VTIEVRPKRLNNVQTLAEIVGKDRALQIYDEYRAISRSGGKPEVNFEQFAVSFPDVAQTLDEIGPIPDDIVQIKGKGNKAPKEDYLPAVQDFVRSGNWSEVGDLQNTGLVSIDKIPEKRLYEAAGMKLPKYVTEKERDDLINEYNRLTVGPTDANFMSEAYGFPPPEGFSRGGAVRGYQAGGAARTLPELQQRYAEGGAVTGANFPTDDYDPARIDAIVAGLQAEMQS
jgi:hypothetical protein